MPLVMPHLGEGEEENATGRGGGECHRYGRGRRGMPVVWEGEEEDASGIGGGGGGCHW